MAAALQLVALVAGLAGASQVVLSEEPAVGNVAYVLPTERTFLLNIPTTYSHDEAYPLVLSFHGGMALHMTIMAEDGKPLANGRV